MTRRYICLPPETRNVQIAANTRQLDRRLTHFRETRNTASLRSRRRSGILPPNTRDRLPRTVGAVTIPKLRFTTIYDSRPVRRDLLRFIADTRDAAHGIPRRYGRQMGRMEFCVARSHKADAVGPRKSVVPPESLLFLFLPLSLFRWFRTKVKSKRAVSLIRKRAVQY